MHHLASGDIDVSYGALPEGQDASVDATVKLMSEMAKGKWGARSPKIRAAAINIINGVDPISGERIGRSVDNKDYFGMLEAIHNYVRDNIRYVKDVIGQETLSYPEEILFNSRAEDCDGMTTLEMALLGSIGLRSYPVVIGLVPNHFSHVYLHAEIPSGKHRYADSTIAADPIMREWPLGMAAPADRVKAKRTYPELAGIGTMAIAGYASGPAYLSPSDELEAAQVPRAMKSRYVDTGSRGEIVNATRLTQWGDELDDMFNRATNVGMPMQAAPAFSLYSRGPITNRNEKVLTSYLGQANPVRRISAPLGQNFQRGRNVVTVQDGKTAKSATIAPTVGELLGLSDYLTDLAGPAARASKQHLVAGHSDPLHRAAAAAALTKQRATKASGRVVRMERNAGFLFGLGDVESTRKLDQAKAIEALAHEIAVKAQNIAEMCAGSSPERQQVLRDNFAALDHMGHYLGVIDAVAQLDPADHPQVDAQNKVDTLTVVSQSPTFRQASTLKASPAMAKRAAKPIVGIMPGGAVVRDQNGDVLYADDGSDDLAGGLGSFFSKISHAVQTIVKAPVKAVQSVGKAVEKGAQSVGKVAEKGVKAVGSTVGKVVGNKNLMLGIATAGASELHRKLTKPLFSSAISAIQSGLHKSGGAAAPVSPSVVTPTSTTPPVVPVDPNTGLPVDPSIVPQPGESTASPSTTDPWSTYGQDDGYMGPSVEAESSQSFEQMSSGGGDGQSFTDTMTVDDSSNPFADDQSSGGGDDASEGDDGSASGGSYDGGGDDGGDDMTEGSDASPAPAPRRKRKHRRAPTEASQDASDLDASDDYGDSDDYDDNEDGGEGDGSDSVESPPVEGLPMVGGMSVGTLALLGLGAYLLLKNRK
jgi:hypothetical protein